MTSWNDLLEPCGLVDWREFPEINDRSSEDEDRLTLVNAGFKVIFEMKEEASSYERTDNIAKEIAKQSLVGKFVSLRYATKGKVVFFFQEEEDAIKVKFIVDDVKTR